MTVLSKDLPRFGLGLAALGRPGYINLRRSDVFDNAGSNMSDVQRRSVNDMQDKANEVMAALVSLSKEKKLLPWFDCARSYGLSEKFVGEFLRNNHFKPDEVVVSSKWGYTYVADWKVSLEAGAPHEIKDHSVDNFLKQIEETKENIGEYLNLYQIHSATFESGVLGDKRVHDALMACKQELGCMIGLSVSGTNQDEIIREAIKITVDGKRLFDSVQCTYNLLEQKPGNALQEAHDAGLDIIIKEGMANGRVLQNGNLQKFASTTGNSADALALACIMAQTFKPRVLSGAVTTDHLNSNAKAIELSQVLEGNRALLQEIMKECAMGCDSVTYWNDRSNLAWN